MSQINPVCSVNVIDPMLDAYAKSKSIDPEKAAEVVSSAFEGALAGKKPNFGQKLNELLINSMLSGLGTPVVNTIGNGIQTLIKPILAVLQSLPKGKEEQRAARAMLSAAFDGWKGDSIFFSSAWKSGLPVDFSITPKSLGLSPKKFDELMQDLGVAPDPTTGEINPEVARQLLGDSYDYMTQAIGGKTGKIIRLPTKLTVAIDEYFKARMRSQRMMNYISRKASKDEADGLGSYDDLYKKYKDEVFLTGKSEDLYGNMERFEQSVGKDFDTAIFDVRNYAKDGTFQSDLIGSMKKIQDLKGEGRNAFQVTLTQIMPFLRTPWNIFLESGGYIPGVGYVIRPTKTITTKKVTTNAAGEEIVNFVTAAERMSMADMHARQLVGLGMTLGMYGLHKEGILTGSEPSDPAERATWQAEGKQPLSIKVGDTWVSYARVEPFATVMGLAADTFAEGDRIMAGKVQPGKEWEEARNVAWSSIKANMLQKTFMQGFHDILVPIFDKDASGAKDIMDNFAKRFVPALSNTFARAIDPSEREAITTIEKMQQRVPYLREMLPEKYAPFSADPNVLAPMQTNTMQALTGVAVAPEQTEFQKRIAAMGVSIAPTPRKLGGVELSTEQLGEYKKLINKYATQRLASSLDFLEKLPNKKVAENIIEKKIMSQARARARFELGRKYPELRKAIQDQKRYDKLGK